MKTKYYDFFLQPFTGILFIVILSIPTPILARTPHIINFRSPNLYPEGLAWDQVAQHFLVGSLYQRTISAVSDAGIVETFISDPSLPENATLFGLAIDSFNNRLLAIIHAIEPLPPFNALAAYDLRSRRRVFLSHLHSDNAAVTRPRPGDVAVDYNGNAFVTNSAENFVWKVNDKGESSIFSKSSLYTAHPVERDTPYGSSGLSGIAYVSKGYLLVVQSSTGKMFKVDTEDGTARQVSLNKLLIGPNGVALRKDGGVLVVSPYKLLFLKSQDSWGQGVVYDETDLDSERFPSAVVVRGRERVYVLYGSVNEGIMGNSGREMFGIEEVRSAKEGEHEKIWVFVLIGLGFVYFLFWRFQMNRLVKKVDKKIS